jgi:hypothetical protein
LRRPEGKALVADKTMSKARKAISKCSLDMGRRSLCVAILPAAVQGIGETAGTGKIVVVKNRTENGHKRERESESERYRRSGPQDRVVARRQSSSPAFLK